MPVLPAMHAKPCLACRIGCSSSDVRGAQQHLNHFVNTGEEAEVDIVAQQVCSMHLAACSRNAAAVMQPSSSIIRRSVINRSCVASR